MADEQNKMPATDEQNDLNKSQPTQQPTGQQGQQPELGQDQAAGQPDDGFQSDTATRQDTDIVGLSQPKEKGEAESGFVGSQSDSDSSSELVEDDEDTAKNDGE